MAEPNRQVTRGDDYLAGRYYARFVVRDGNGDPVDLTGHSVRTTYKLEPTDVLGDPDDAQALVRHRLVVDGTGAATTQTGLFLVGPASNGTVEERMSRAETATFPTDQGLVSDIQVTVPAGDVITLPVDEVVIGVDGVTNRTTG